MSRSPSLQERAHWERAGCQGHLCTYGFFRDFSPPQWLSVAMRGLSLSGQHPASTGRYRLNFTSKSRSGDPTEDDQVVSIRWGNKSSVTLPVKEALYVPGRFTTDSVNHCKSIGAFKWGQGRLLLLLPRDDRPSEDRITAVVIDSATGSFVEDGGDIGPFGDEVDLLSDSRGYRALLLRKWYQDPNTYGEFGGPDWMRIFDLNGHIHHTWDVVRP